MMFAVKLQFFTFIYVQVKCTSDIAGQQVSVNEGDATS